MSEYSRLHPGVSGIDPHNSAEWELAFPWGADE